MGKFYFDYYIQGETTVFVILFIIISGIMISRQLLAAIFYFDRFIKKRSEKVDYAKVSSLSGVTSIVTCAAEKPEVFENSMRTLFEQKNLGRHTILVMLDAFDNPNPDDLKCLEIAEKYADKIYTTNVRDKRINIANLIKFATEEKILNEFIVFMDSDTVCEDHFVLANLVRAFNDKKVGGATTSQRCLKVETVAERIGDWLEHARLLSSMAAGSLFGQVGCLPGRLYMVRKAAIVSQIAFLPLENWKAWRFSRKFPFVEVFQTHCKAGDDRWITNSILSQGFKTVLVPEAKVRTLVPENLKKMFLTWKRWGISSQGYVYRTLTWSWRKPYMLFQFFSDIFITHASIFLVWNWVYALIFKESKDHLPLSLMIFVSFGGMMLTFLFRQLPHLIKHPKDLFYLPLFMLAVTVGQHIRFYTHYYWKDIGTWGTRLGLDSKVKNTWVKEHSMAKELNKISL
jgi:cellulose synthase/poly-beta-1,6-N-acetylglucosamine synthase-like glycosyltransferase